MKPSKHQRSKQRSQDLCWKVHNCAQNFWFCTHALCISYVTETFLLVSSQYGVNNYCVLYTVKAKKREQQHTTKNLVDQVS